MFNISRLGRDTTFHLIAVLVVALLLACLMYVVHVEVLLETLVRTVELQISHEKIFVDEFNSVTLRELEKRIVTNVTGAFVKSTFSIPSNSFVSSHTSTEAVSASREPISAIMARAGTDKLTRHAYDRYYELHFKDFRDRKDLSLLEIGAQTGASIRLWAEYFTHASAIHAVAYGLVDGQDPLKMVCDQYPPGCSKVVMFNGDQSDPVFLRTIYEKYKYDIIVDDGSHHPAHQIISLKHLFQAVNPGGLYVIEDIESSYWNQPHNTLYGYTIDKGGIGAPPQYSAIEKIKQFVDVLNRFHMAHPGLHIFPDDDKFFSVTFGQGIVIIRKSTDAELQHPPNVPVAPVLHDVIDQWAREAAKSNQ